MGILEVTVLVGKEKASGGAIPIETAKQRQVGPAHRRACVLGHAATAGERPR